MNHRLLLILSLIPGALVAVVVPLASDEQRFDEDRKALLGIGLGYGHHFGKTYEVDVVTGATESSALSLDDIIAEVAAARETERGGRSDDKRSEAAMEDRKKQGYF